jgi:3D (Asp-Asp-Asp) domain-containing protein
MKIHLSNRSARALMIAGIVVLPQMASTSAPSGAVARPPQIVPVKATAYSSGVQCNGAWPARNAVGGRLKSGEVNSAAADWSRFPVGTKFRVKETGKVYQVDDYGSAMVGKDKVDLFMPDYRQVNRWGVRSVSLEIVEWGSAEKSLKILKPRAKSKHVRKMVEQLEAKLRAASPNNG